jgi:PRTRC genetic system protein B
MDSKKAPSQSNSPPLRRVPGVKWAVPPELEVPADKLLTRMDFYEEAIVLFTMDGRRRLAKLISALDVSNVFLREMTFNSGILPQDALWWGMDRNGPIVAVWREPQRWKVALQLEAFKPAERFTLPMPGLVFICRPGSPPYLYGAKSRPQCPADQLYHAPCFNVFRSGQTCAGSHKYPDDVTAIPESFFASFFTQAADAQERSKKHPGDLLAWWREINGKQRYPVGDLVPACTVGQLLGDTGRRVP